MLYEVITIQIEIPGGQGQPTVIAGQGLLGGPSLPIGQPQVVEGAHIGRVVPQHILPKRQLGPIDLVSPMGCQGQGQGKADAQPTAMAHASQGIGQGQVKA